MQAVKRDDGQGLLGPGQGPVDHHVDDAGDLGLHCLDRGLPGGRHAPPVHELQGQGGVPRRGGHGLDDPLVAVGRQEGGDAGVEAVAGGRQGPRGQERAELGGQAGRGAPGVADDEHLLGAHEGGQHLRDGHGRGGVQHGQVHHCGGREDLGHERGRDDPDRPGQQGHGVGVDDLPQRDPVLAGQGDVQGARVGLVLLDGGPHPPGAGLGHRAGQGARVGGVELAQRDGHVGQGARVETAEVGVGGEGLRQQGGPPAVGELGLELVGLDAAGGHVGHEVVQSQGLELGADAVDLGELLGGEVVGSQGAGQLQEILQGHLHEHRGVLGAPQQRLHLGHGAAGPAGGASHLVQALGQAGPATVRVVAAPHLTAALDLDQLGVQVIDDTARPHQVVGLPCEAPAPRAIHVNAPLVAPALGGGGDDHVGGGALEDLGQEDVQGLAHAVEHVELLDPLAQVAGPAQACGAGDHGRVLLDGGQQVVGQGAQVDERIGGLIHVLHRDPVPSAGGDLRGEQPQGVPAAQEGQSLLPTVLIEATQVLGVDAGPGGRPVATAGELGELLQRLVGGDRPGLAGPVQGAHVAVQAGADRGEAVA